MNDLERYRELSKTPEFKAFRREYRKKIRKRERRIDLAHHRYESLTNEEFKQVVNKQIALHGERWKDTCYHKGYEPYPKRDLDMIFKIARKHGKSEKPQQKNFIEECFRYKGLLFRLIHGQGTICVIGTEKNRLLTL